MRRAVQVLENLNPEDPEQAPLYRRARQELRGMLGIRDERVPRRADPGDDATGDVNGSATDGVTGGATTD